MKKEETLIIGKRKYHKIYGKGNFSDYYGIVKEKKFLFFTFYFQLFYVGQSSYGNVGSPYLSPFDNFEHAVYNRCENPWNGGEKWVLIDNLNSLHFFRL